ncbi:two component, sigma54 specific, transcriptional regulator, Fis family [Thermodesulfatator indicus DSM 15286]|uniref:Two component, sigma54 specific, transcriptional regulator, Fis family n=1 Tax=Thermodesulfatator indicus (strain DSM 15286 / JCM 11887 / CIR29812) TaxID=667014 RepID=F8ABX1_THEID|nr:sigma-54 dependent transcriptional regulator [Thermodesulfatator indicus]AEH45663.1 two component, sigma54 specific, transcriptional regulator, Fis family [Thermodesulfatator indicus DSM 15286]
MPETILLLDKKEKDLAPLAEALMEKGLSPIWGFNREEAFSILEEQDIGAVVANLENEEFGRLKILKDLNSFNPLIPVILLTQEADLEEAVQAIKAGAADYRLLSTEPALLTEIILKVKRTYEPPEGSFITANQRLKLILARLKEVAKSKATVLITGESGTGKEVLARFIHENSDRARGPFIAINCAALPEHLLESELFGYEKGAFSGAFTRKLGKFELANGGTILLDEITEMPLSLQAKLLRVLQEGEVDRLGGAYPVKIDVRVIATTNRDVQALVSQGKFREDLYFRLNVIPVEIPPLRERPEDVRLLAQKFCEEFSQKYNRPVKGFADGVLEKLSQYPWPGNVRELRNLIERAVLLAQGTWITLKDIFPKPLGAKGQDMPLKPLREVEREMIMKALRAANGNRTRAAEILGISVRTLRNKLQIYREAGLI